MKTLYKKLLEDVRLKEGLNACFNCGTCTAICPAAEFYNYDPRQVIDTVQSKDDSKILELLKGETIWYCGECMSCKTRCPRSNAPGLVIIALRALSIKTGNFIESEKGRQLLALKRTIGDTILKYGYCVHIDEMTTEMHPEQGPIWDWYRNNRKAVLDRLGGNYGQEGAGILRKISNQNLDELQKIFDVTGATEQFNYIEECSRKKALELKLEFSSGQDEYFNHVYEVNNMNHHKI
ncbi:MAG: hypothetical protein A2033_11870 [Bacteroidetes bacterium GWA2_31_9]|nr:MAG: hypothetical protein A2033_11870 [Bacteroidetes bacterium GWA2_31_9]